MLDPDEMTGKETEIEIEVVLEKPRRTKDSWKEESTVASMDEEPGTSKPSNLRETGEMDEVNRSDANMHEKDRARSEEGDEDITCVPTTTDSEESVLSGLK